jgi:predicted nucleotidyltransferase
MMHDVTFQQAPSFEWLQNKRDAILTLAARYGAYNVRVFGSVARGEATSNSDVDFLVSFRDNASLYELSGLQQGLQELLGYSVDVVTDDENPRRHRFLRRVLEDAVTL